MTSTNTTGEAFINLNAGGNRDGMNAGDPHIIDDVRMTPSDGQADLALPRRPTATTGIRTLRASPEKHGATAESTRMAALGSLFGGLGHYVSNLLLPLRLRLEAMQIRGISPELAEDLRAAAQCTDLLQRMSKGFSLLALDPAQPGTRCTELPEWWNELSAFLRIALPRGVDLQHDFAETASTALVAKHRLAQIVFGMVRVLGRTIPQGAAAVVKVTAEPVDSEKLSIRVTTSIPEDAAGTSPGKIAGPSSPRIAAAAIMAALADVADVAHAIGGTLQVDATGDRGSSVSVIIARAGPGDQWNHATSSAPAIDARVTVADPRTSRYIAVLLKILDANVVTDAAPDADHRALWICESPGPSPAELASFLNGGAHRRVLLFGPRPEDIDGDGRVVNFIDRPSPAVLRENLRTLIQQLKSSVDADQ